MSGDEKFLPYSGEPDIERLIRAMRRQEVDRVPNVEIVIEDRPDRREDTWTLWGQYPGLWWRSCQGSG